MSTTDHTGSEAGLLAADSVAALERRVSVLASTLDRMESRLEEAEVNGEPLGWWDANRQGLHDRIAGTVVLREGKRPEENREQQRQEEDER